MTDAIQEFNVLSDFLLFMDPGMDPRGSVSEEDQTLLTRIAEGSCSDSDREEALQILATNSDAIEFFAQKLNDN